MSHQPPLFKNFGKGIKDLLEKKFDFDRDLKVKTSTGGLAFETTGRSQSKGGDLVGLLKTTYKRGDFGTFELENDTLGKGKVSIEADKYRKGLAVKLTGDLAPTAGLDASYSQEYVSASAGVTHSFNKTTAFDASGALGYDGLFVGGALKWDKVKQDFDDFNTGVEYAQPDFTLTLKTTDRTNKVNLSYLHSVNPDVSVGASFGYDLKTINSKLNLVGSYALDRDTTTKAKFSSDGLFTAALEQRLYNPKLKYGAAAEFDLKQLPAPAKFGLNITLGDA